MKLPFGTVDVLTEHRFGGNPLAVVVDVPEISQRAHAEHCARIQSARDSVCHQTA
jgi:predicted PhzF superfamily epimerase YddE/YHI9